MTRQQLEKILSRHTHRMHGGTEYYSSEGVFHAIREAAPDIAPEVAASLINHASAKRGVGEDYHKADILDAMEQAVASISQTQS